MEIPDFLYIGWENGWWFTVVFALVNLFFMISYPRSFSKRLLRFPPFESLFDKVISFTSMILFMRGMMILTIFVTFDFQSLWFYIGMTIYLAGLLFYIIALKNFADTDEDKPVLTGAYRLSRHPMQVFSIFMWIGVALATGSRIILAVCLIQPFLAYRFLKSQEQYCLAQFGTPYREYLQKTPRYIFR
jgi:protein-S-isoprenylcysteine O-methyltransferase Ste14